MSEIDVSKCRFQSECIEYKDISVNHIINILEPCPCFKMSMAINKENNCKYFTIYKQLQQVKQENEELKEKLEIYRNPDVIKALTYYSCAEFEVIYRQNQELNQKLEKLKEECKQAPAIDTELSLRMLEIIESEE